MRREATIAAAVAASALLGACGSSVVAPKATDAPAPAAPTTTTPSTTSAPSSTATSASTVPSTTTSTSSTTVATTGVTLPISVQSDAQMVAAGNQGPSSSILAPAGCTFSGATVTAAGSYTNGGLAPEVYDRYGDIVRLYVFTAARPGYPQGVQLADLGAETAPPIGGRGTWSVSAPVELSLGTPAGCVVAAQPTHDVQLAPP